VNTDSRCFGEFFLSTPERIMTFQERLENLWELFELRNAIYHRGDSLKELLIVGIAHFGRLLRKSERDPAVLGKALASIFSRTSTWANTFNRLPIVDALCEKYPVGRCAYCGETQCTCQPDKRPIITHATILAEEQRSWSVNEWTAHLDTVYGATNRQRGLHFAYLRLFEEIGEIGLVQLLDVYNPELSLDDVRRNMAREFADVFAWIMSISAMIEIDLDKVLDEQYPHVHRRCGQRPCICGPFHQYPRSATGTRVES
jgi:NTP pyrophosphatase (non-canonical NTP hydrolase)